MMLVSVIALPLLGAMLSKLVPRLVWAGLVATAAATALFVFYMAVEYNADAADVSSMLHFATAGDVDISLSFRADFIPICMGGMVLAVSLLIQIYALGSFQEEARARLFPLLALFTSMMLVLTFSDNLLTLYMGWEGVSIVSYFAIGLRYDRPGVSTAAMRAFVINRVGDMFFLFGIIALYAATKSLEFKDIFDNMMTADSGMLQVAAACIMVGALAKSAQIGFHVWLPDAMVAPTPVSALLHSATLVVAGVYVVIRMFLLFELASAVLDIMMWIGLVSALYSALLASVQTNIKRIIAYSTISQIGLMLVFLGLGQPMLAFLYLLNHAFYKSLMFLAAGSVIHGVSHDMDINRMGGLWKHMPFTYVFMVASMISLNAVPFMAGYAAKESLLSYANSSSPLAVYGILGVIFLSAGYSFRMFYKVFHGKPNEEDAVMARVHEANWPMQAGMVGLVILLAVLSAYAGEWFLIEHAAAPKLTAVSMFLMGVGVVMAFIASKTPEIGMFKKFINDRRDFEELYLMLFIRPVRALGRMFLMIGDIKILGAFDKLAAKAVNIVAREAQPREENVPTYSLGAAIGLLGVVAYVIAKGVLP